MMPMIHPELVVTDIRQAILLYLNTLGSIGYRYLGRDEDRLTFARDQDAVLFVVPNVQGTRASPKHVIVRSPDRRSVYNFYTAALTAGARPHHRPGCKDTSETTFRASVVDYDGNILEALYDDRGTVVSSSAKQRVSDDRRSCTHEAESVVSKASHATSKSSGSKGNKSNRAASSMTSRGSNHSQRESTGAPAGSVLNKPCNDQQPRQDKTMCLSSSNMSAETVLEVLQKSMLIGQRSTNGLSSSTLEISPRTLAGVFIGAAAGAAVAYAACQSEEDSARAELQASVAASRLIEARQKRAAQKDQVRSKTSRGIAYSTLQIEQSIRLPVPEAPMHPRIVELAESEISTRSRARSSRSQISKTSAATSSSKKHNARRSSSKSSSATSKKSQASSKSTCRSHTGSETKSRKCRSDGGEKLSEIRANCERASTPPPEFLELVRRGEECDTVIPDDSISRIGLQRRRSRRHPEFGRNCYSDIYDMPPTRTMAQHPRGSAAFASPGHHGIASKGEPRMSSHPQILSMPMRGVPYSDVGVSRSTRYY